MMNVPPSEAGRLSLYDYESLLHHWNEAHRNPDDVKAPDPKTTQALLDRLNADPRLTTGKPKGPKGPKA